MKRARTEHQGGGGSAYCNDSTRLFVGGLGQSVTEETLRSLFEPYGDVQNISLKTGYAFVTMDDRLNVTKAQQALDGTMLGGKSLRLRLVDNGNTIWVGDLTAGCTNERLGEAFSAYGHVSRAVVMCNARGEPYGYGLVEFSDRRAAEKALQVGQQEMVLLGRTPRPVRIAPYRHTDPLGIPAYHEQYHVQEELMVPPRHAEAGTAECEIAMRWRMLQEAEQQEKDAMKARWKQQRAALESETESVVQQEAARREMQQRMEEGQLRAQEEQLRLQAMLAMQQQMPPMMHQQMMPGWQQMQQPSPYEAGMAAAQQQVQMLGIQPHGGGFHQEQKSMAQLMQGGPLAMPQLQMQQHGMEWGGEGMGNTGNPSLSGTGMRQQTARQAHQARQQKHTSGGQGSTPNKQGSNKGRPVWRKFS